MTRFKPKNNTIYNINHFYCANILERPKLGGVPEEKELSSSNRYAVPVVNSWIGTLRIQQKYHHNPTTAVSSVPRYHLSLKPFKVLVTTIGICRVQGRDCRVDRRSAGHRRLAVWRLLPVVRNYYNCNKHF